MTTLSGEPAMGSIDLPCTTTSSTSLGRCLLWGWLSAIYDFIACLYKCGPDRPQARHNPSPHSAWNTPRCPWTKHQLATSLLLIAKTYPRSASSTTRLRSATPLCSRGFYRHSWWHEGVAPIGPKHDKALTGPPLYRWMLTQISTAVWILGSVLKHTDIAPIGLKHDNALS